MQKKKAQPKSPKRTIDSKLASIQSRLRTGDITRIAELSGYDPSHVSRVLRGIRQNSEIIKQASSHLAGRRAKA